MTSPTKISANSIAQCFVNNAKFKDHNWTFTHYVNVRLNEAWKAAYPAGKEDVDFCENFIKQELKIAI